MLAVFVEDVLWSKYPALLARYILDFEWLPSYTLVLLVLISAIRLNPVNPVNDVSPWPL